MPIRESDFLFTNLNSLPTHPDHDATNAPLNPTRRSLPSPSITSREEYLFLFLFFTRRGRVALSLSHARAAARARAALFDHSPPRAAPSRHGDPPHHIVARPPPHPTHAHAAPHLLLHSPTHTPSSDAPFSLATHLTHANPSSHTPPHTSHPTRDPSPYPITLIFSSRPLRIIGEPHPHATLHLTHARSTPPFRTPPPIPATTRAPAPRTRKP